MDISSFPSCCGIQVLHDFRIDNAFCKSPKTLAAAKKQNGNESCGDCTQYDIQDKKSRYTDYFYVQSEDCRTEESYKEDLRDQVDGTEATLLVAALVTNTDCDNSQIIAAKILKSLGFKALTTFVNGNSGNTITVLALRQ